MRLLHLTHHGCTTTASRVSLSDSSNDPAGQSTIQTRWTEAALQGQQGQRASDCRRVFVCSVPLREPCVVSPEGDRSNFNAQVVVVGSHAPPDLEDR